MLMICSLTDLHTGHFYLHRDGFFGAAFLTMMSNLSAGTSIINMYHEDIPVLLDSCLGLPMLSLFQRCEHRGPHISIPKSVPDPSHWAFTTEVLRCARSVLGEPCQASPPPPPHLWLTQYPETGALSCTVPLWCLTANIFLQNLCW